MILRFCSGSVMKNWLSSNSPGLLVGTQKVFTLNQRKGGLVDGLHDNSFLFAQGAVASVNTVVNCIGFYLKTDFRAMASATISIHCLFLLRSGGARNSLSVNFYHSSRHYTSFYFCNRLHRF